MSERPVPDLPSAYAALHGWDREYEQFGDFDLPTYVGPTSFMKLPWISDPAELARRKPRIAVVVLKVRASHTGYRVADVV